MEALSKSPITAYGDGFIERAQKLALLKKTYGLYPNFSSMPQLLTDSLNPYFNNATDWQGLFYRNAAVDNADLSISAANEIVNYRVSMNYYNEQGTIRDFDFKRYSVRGNFDFKLSPKLNSQFIFSLSHSDRARGDKLSNTDNNTPFNINNGNLPSSFFGLTAFDSANFWPAITPQPKYQRLVFGSPDAELAAIIPDCGLRARAPFPPRSPTRTTRPSNQDQVQALDGISQASYAESDANSYVNYFISNSLNYSKTFLKNSHVVVTGTQQFNEDISKVTSASGYNVPSNDIQVVNGIPQQYLSASSDYQSSAILSFAGQIQYDYNSRYIVYVADRADASSRFGSESKWGKFPSAGVGWIVSDESFMNGAKKYVNFLKLRASYGLSGQQSLDYYVL